jgi:hypothetical protein
MKAPDSTNKEAENPDEAAQKKDTEGLYYRHSELINTDKKKDIYKFGGGGIPKSNQKDGGTYIGTNAKGEDLSYTRNAKEIINDYETVSYIKIPTDRKSGAPADIDFRSLLTEDSNEFKRAEEENHRFHNIETKFNFGNPGKVDPNENRVNWQNQDKTDDGFLDRFDKVNASDITTVDPKQNRADEMDDLIRLWFKMGKERIQFRGTVSGITDTFSPSWDSIKYNGRADQAYQYKTFERSLSFNFKVYATSRIEMKPIYNKLAKLAKMTMPAYGTSDGYTGNLIEFRLGSLFDSGNSPSSASNKRQAFIESLSYSMSDETPWDINRDLKLGELPMGVDVSIGLKILGEKPSSIMKKVYDTVF